MNRKILLIDAVRVAFGYKLNYLHKATGPSGPYELSDSFRIAHNSLNCKERIKDGYGVIAIRGWFRFVCKDLTATDKEIEELTTIFFETI